MGKAADAAGDGGAAPRDRGARDAREIRRRRRAPRTAAQHTASRWRVRPGRASTVTSPLSASRADQKQLSASTEQVRERRPRVGGRGGGAGGSARRQEGRATAEGDALVGAHGSARRTGPAAGRHGAGAGRGDGPAPRRAPRAPTAPRTPYTPHTSRTARGPRAHCAHRTARTARRVTSRAHTTPRLHSIVGPVARAARSIIDLVFIYSPRPRSSRRL